MVANSDNNTTDLKWLSRDILITLRKQDGVANMTEIKEATGVEKNHKIDYRLFEKLEPRDLVQVNSPEPVNNQPQPKVASLTSRGEGLADQLINESASKEVTTTEEVEQLRAEMNKLTTTVEEQQEQIEALQDRYDKMYNIIADD